MNTDFNKLFSLYEDNKKKFVINLRNLDYENFKYDENYNEYYSDYIIENIVNLDINDIVHAYKKCELNPIKYVSYKSHIINFESIINISNKNNDEKYYINLKVYDNLDPNLLYKSNINYKIYINGSYAKL